MAATTTTTTTRTTRNKKVTDPTEAAKAARAAKATTTTKAPARKAPAAKKATTTKAPAAPVVETDRIKKLAAAKVEKAALDTWVAGGKKGTKPVTPNLDSLAASPASTRAKKATTTPRVAQSVDYFHDGKACPASQNRLSSLAWYYTKGIDGDEPRISAAALVILLKKAGVENPTTTAWKVELPNGVTLQAKARKAAKA